jgi:hypothetical protein
MKVLVFVKATANSEKGLPQPDETLAKMFAEMGKFNEKLVKAGIMKEADGLKPSSFGKRIEFSDEGYTAVIDGPFAETKELVAGYWVWDVKSMADAVEWAKQCPNPMPGEVGTLEIRPAYTLEDFADIAPKQEFAREEKLRKLVARQNRNSRPAKKKAKAKSKAAPRKPAKAKAKSKARSKK